ncbi:MAG: hypothetical protein HYV78_00030 [Candidatus Wildermuthbacteria bacterium]|nr:hypothetical protein [Candidatus Wildermuthbacteria bacterium]
MNINFLVLRESAPLAYGEEERGPFYEKDLVRAQFVAELNERLGWPLSSIYVNVLVFAEGAGFQQIDVVVSNKEGGVMIAALVESPQEYESQREQRLRGLFKIAFALAKTEKVYRIAYYTRWYDRGMLRKRQIIIDYATHFTYEAWEAAGFPTLEDFPAHGA